MKKVGAREVVQCLNDNLLWGLDVNIDLSGSLVGRHAVGDVRNIATSKNNKTPCNQMSRIATEKVYYFSRAVLTPAECSLLELPVQIDSSASLVLFNSSVIRCFVQ